MSSNIYDSIDDYLNGKLEGDDLKAFEKQLSVDEKLANQVELYRLEKEGIELLIEDDLRQNMRIWQKKRRSFYKSLWFLIGLPAVIGLIIYWLFNTFNTGQNIKISQPLPTEQPKDSFKKNDTPSVPIVENKDIHRQEKIKTPSIKDNTSIALALNHYESPNFSPDILKGDTPNNDPLSLVIKAWNSNDFPKVVELSQAFNKDCKVYIRAQEMQGHAYFKMKNFKKAEEVFNNIVQNDSGAIAEDAEWYRFLALVASGKRSDANLILKRILADPQHRKFDNASKFVF